MVILVTKVTNVKFFHNGEFYNVKRKYVSFYVSVTVRGSFS